MLISHVHQETRLWRQPKSSVRGRVGHCGFQWIGWVHVRMVISFIGNLEGVKWSRCSCLFLVSKDPLKDVTMNRRIRKCPESLSRVGILSRKLRRVDNMIARLTKNQNADLKVTRLGIHKSGRLRVRHLDVLKRRRSCARGMNVCEGQHPLCSHLPWVVDYWRKCFNSAIMCSTVLCRITVKCCVVADVEVQQSCL